MNHGGAESKPRVEIFEFDNSHASLLAEFVRKVWDPSATPEKVVSGREGIASTNPGCIDGRIPTVLLLYNGVVVGHMTSIPDRLHIGGSSQPVSWTAGFHVLPEHRNGPIGVMVAKEMARIAPASMCTTVIDASLRIFKAMGWSHVGTIPNWVLLINGGNIAQRIDPDAVGLPRKLSRAVRITQKLGVARFGGWLVSSIIRLRMAAVGSSAKGVRFEHVDLKTWNGFDEADVLWENCSPSIAASLVRDGKRLKWRFSVNAERYCMIAAREAEKLVGWIVIKRPTGASDDRLKGLRVAPMVDLLFPPDRMEIAAGLLNNVASFVRGEHIADALMVSTPYSPIQELMRRLWSRNMGGNLQLVVHPSLFPSPPPRFEEWWHARGDGDSDGSF